ncbi:MAG: phosphoribosylformylglycinamidine synthase subunit PurS [Chloroflexi bacterium]|nr:MAG: phosphoribosylformylglycinamidine synthase subunit PurS [Chloroflexota bacterium]
MGSRRSGLVRPRASGADRRHRLRRPLIFVDTSFWVAYYNSRDPRHREAVELIHDAAGLVTTNHIRGETWTLLRRRTDHALAAKFLDRTERSSELRTVFVSAHPRCPHIRRRLHGGGIQEAELMPRFVARVLIRPKAEIRDPQGEAISGALRSLGHEIADVRTGKEILVSFDAADERAARDEAARMGDELLANPVIESYAVEVEAVRTEAHA